MTERQVALYARVSSEQQAEAKTIESQLDEIRVQIATDGIDLSTILEFVDEGYSGSTLVRPALERLRDVVAAGGSAITPIKSYWLRNSPDAVWRLFSSIGPWGRRQRISYCCKSRE